MNFHENRLLTIFMKYRTLIFQTVKAAYEKAAGTFQQGVRCFVGLVSTKPVFGVSDKARFKPVVQLQRLARKLKFHLWQVMI